MIGKSVQRTILTVTAYAVGLCVVLAENGRIEIAPADVARVPATYEITEPGSYVLTGNLVLDGVDDTAIHVRTNHVTIDLNGFSISSTGGDRYGIYQDTWCSDLTVKNGTISGWSTSGFPGLYAVGRGTRLIDLRANANYYGLLVGHQALIKNCTAVSNGYHGIYAGSGSIIKNCSSVGNRGDGFVLADGCTIVNCTARDNTGDGFDTRHGNVFRNCTAQDNDAYGFLAVNGCAVSSCTMLSNQSAMAISVGSVVGHSVARGSTGNGFYSSNGTLFHNCTATENDTGFWLNHGGYVCESVASSNSTDGIQVRWASRADRNTCRDNAYAGVWARDEDCYVARNRVSGNPRGIEVDVDGNMVVKNMADESPTANYSIFGVNVVGTITADPSNTYENANLSF